MTFSVVAVCSEPQKRERVVGTIWAAGEDEAHCVASSLCACEGQGESIELRRADIREIPLRLPN